VLSRFACTAQTPVRFCQRIVKNRILGVENSYTCVEKLQHLCKSSAETSTENFTHALLLFKNNLLACWHADCIDKAVVVLIQKENAMKTVAQINVHDLATAFIAFGLVLGFAFR
jgi:hypothetical protein